MRAPSLTVSRLSNYECGEREPDMETICLLARVLETTPAFLLDLIEEPITDEENLVLNYFRTADHHARSILLRIATDPSLTDAERKLLRNFRAADDRGKSIILRLAESEAKSPTESAKSK